MRNVFPGGDARQKYARIRFPPLNKKDMKQNMGGTDRIVRVTIAVVLSVLYLSGIVEGVLGTVLLAIAAIMLLTSFVAFCPLYLPFGLSTLGKKELNP